MAVIHFILVEPAVPENVGFATRALKTMGFGPMRLINPCDYLSKPARKTAYASHDLLEESQIYSSLAESIADLDLTIATTAKKRTSRVEVLHPRELGKEIQAKGSTVRNIGIIFGREESGLTTEEINLCDLVSSTPLQTSYPSLNLAQSVLLYAYELSAFSKPEEGNESTKAPEVVMKELRTKVLSTLDWLEIDKQPSLYQRIIDRVMLAKEDDVHLMLSLIKKLDHKRRN